MIGGSRIEDPYIVEVRHDAFQAPGYLGDGFDEPTRRSFSALWDDEPLEQLRRGGNRRDRNGVWMRLDLVEIRYSVDCEMILPFPRESSTSSTRGMGR